MSRKTEPSNQTAPTFTPISSPTNLPTNNDCVIVDARPLKRKSPVWTYFVQHPTDTTKIACTICANHETKWRSMRSSTHTLAVHLERVHGIVFHQNGSQKKPKLISISNEEKNHFDLLLFRWLTTRNLSYSMVNSREMKDMMGALHPGYSMASVETLKSILEQQTKIVNAKVRTYLQTNLVAGSLSADGWTAVNGDAYFGLLLHFIDDGGVHQTVLLSALPKTGSQTAIALATRIREILDLWGLTSEYSNPLTKRKIKWFTSDTTNVMPATVRDLGFEWIPCFAHVLNLIVQDALKSSPVIRDILMRCRKICTYFKKSSLMQQRLVAIQIELDMRNEKLNVDVKTRWNSTLDMLEKLIRNKIPIIHLLPLITFDTPLPTTREDKKKRKRQMTVGEWGLVESMIALLQPFRDGTKAFETEKLPTLSIVIPYIKWLKKELVKTKPQEGTVLYTMWSKLGEGFDIRFPPIINNSDHYCFAVFFNPRSKDILKSDGREYLGIVQAARARYGEKKTLSQPMSQPITTPTPPLPTNSTSFLDQILSQRQQEKQDEFDLYCVASPCPSHVKPATWFFEHKFLTIFQLYQEYCCAPGSSSSVERLWSVSGHLLDRKRSRLTGPLVDMRLQWKKNSIIFSEF